MIAITADIHVHNFEPHGGPFVSGLNQRVQLCLNALDAALKTAQKAKVSHFIVAGDLFHVRQPDPAVLLSVRELLYQSWEFERIVLLGNHEQLPSSRGPEDTALTALARAAEDLYSPKVSVRLVPVTYTVTIGDRRVALVPFHRGSATDNLLDSASRIKRADVLIGHYGLYEPGHGGWQAEADDYVSVPVAAKAAKRIGAHTVVMGHDHRHAHYHHGDVNIWQVGALGPHSFKDDGPVDAYGSLLLLDEATGKMDRQVIPGPRFHLGVPARPTDQDFVRLTAPVAPEHKEGLGLGKVGGWEVVPEAPQSEEMPKVLPQRIEDAIRQYVRKRVPKKLQKAVLGQALELWRQAHAD